jgi:hypothetical protein
LQCEYRARNTGKTLFWNGYYVVFQNYDTIEPFEDDQHITIEEILRKDDGILTAIEMVHEIVARTRVLLSPQFITLSRRARFATD